MGWVCASPRWSSRRGPGVAMSPDISTNTLPFSSLSSGVLVCPRSPALTTSSITPRHQTITTLPTATHPVRLHPRAMASQRLAIFSKPSTLLRMETIILNCLRESNLTPTGGSLHFIASEAPTCRGAIHCASQRGEPTKGTLAQFIAPLHLAVYKTLTCSNPPCGGQAGMGGVSQLGQFCLWAVNCIISIISLLTVILTTEVIAGVFI
jgi:hypothetical protein